MNRPHIEKLDAFIEAYTDKNHNTGKLRITSRDEIVYEKDIGFADNVNTVPFVKNSMFTLYSLSKPFCAIGLMKLYDKGLVDVDAHPSRYLPEAQGFDKDVTIRQILHHIGGIPDFTQNGEFHKKYENGHPVHMREHLKEIAGYPMVSKPGTSAMYANVNYVIAALIIENVSGQKYRDYMKKEVFEPFEMPFAVVDEPSMHIDNRVSGHELRDGVLVCVDKTYDWMFGAGDIVGTVDDVYCLNKAIKQEKMLKPDTWRQILTPSPLNHMGLGCTVTNWHGLRRITHNGGSRGFRTLHIQLPETDFDIIYLSNAGFGDARNDYAAAIYEAFFGDTAPDGEKIKMDAGYI